MTDSQQRQETEAIELARIAELYYYQHLKQADIGERFGISKMQVSRLLRRALERGIVEILIHYPLAVDHELSSRLADRYGLEEAVVVEDAGQTPRDAIAHAAAQYLVGHLPASTTLAVAWSSMVAATAELLPKRPLGSTRVVQMIGAVTMSANRANPFDACTKLGRALSAETFPLHAPAFLESKSARETLLSEAPIARTLALARKADCAIIGIGNTTPESTFCKAGFVTPREMEVLAGRGAVGDVLGQFFDIHGGPVPWRLSGNVVGLTLEDLGRIRTVIGVAGGDDKRTAILGALRGRMLSVLITDKDTADYLLSEPRAAAPAGTEVPSTRLRRGDT
ncbi:MAG: sugar-binding transcriptional regulator [Deinococcales bacterium]